MSILRGICAGGMALAMSLAHAQHWEATGVPPMDSPRICYADTVHDALYIGGDFFFSGSTCYPLYRYQDSQWDTLECFGNSIRSAIVYHDTLIVGGGFSTVGSSPIQTIAYYADGTWNAYGDIQGVVSRLRIIDGELYAIGYFYYADNNFCNGLAKRVGGHWENVGVLPVFNGDGSAWFLDAISYQGRLIVTGNFTSADGSINDVMAYDGNSWQPICDCLQGGFDGGGALIVYQGDLYLGGIFYYNSGNAGEGLMKWDGDQWSMVGQSGGGLQLYNYSDAYSPSIHDFAVRDGLLLVAGSFSFADHLPAVNIASWDGNHWCSLGGTTDVYVTAMAFYHDTLYVGCGPNADGQPVNGVARFIGSSYQENCAATGIEEEVSTGEELHVLTPRPGAIILSGLSDGPHELRIYDAEGRMVLVRPVRSTGGRTGEVPVQLNSAIYIIRVDDGRTAKFIPVR